LTTIPQAIASPNAININNKLEQKALTLLKNEKILPLKRTSCSDSMALLCIGRSEYQKEYKEIVSQYGMAYVYQDKSISDKTKATVCKQITDKLAPYSTVIIAYGGSNQMANKKYGTDENVIALLKQIAKDKKTVLIHMGNPYVLNYFGSTKEYNALMVTYQPTPSTLKSALEACFGEIACEGTLPVSTNEYPGGAGIITQTDTNFSLLPEACTKQIDNLLQQGIRDKVYPGCVVLAMQDGKTIYRKAFGYYTYDQQDKVTPSTMYDVASITKTAATTLAVMKLYDEDKIKLHDHIGEYLPYLHGTNKAHITLEELLTHTSGLPAFIPFYTKIQNDTNYLRCSKSPNFEIKVADNLYLRNDYPDTMRNTIAHCKLGGHQYLYSDLNMVLLKDMVETITGQPMDQYLTEHFYRPMGLSHTCFNPLEHGFIKSEIAPTEKDETFRKQVVQGYVHDQTAALFYGNAGDAGLFTTAGELAAIYQMLLDGGVYNGKRYFSEKTVDLFTSTHPQHGCEIRGLGFHTPKHPGSSSIVPAKASKKIFGHQGFTGTVVWCDPDNRLIYVFLSNRVYPTCYPNKLSQSGIRLKAHEMIYQGIEK
ncbi:MAG: serine hydrolase, partial [Muribaculaceae bacterium]|nr:serine hydrolase [Muribaculaceae bacterium]